MEPNNFFSFIMEPILSGPGGAHNPHQHNNKNITNEVSKNTNPIYPKFLVISSVSGQLSKVSPFIIQKAQLGIGGNPTQTVKRLRSGDLLIETTSELQSKSFLFGKTINNIPITVTP